MPSAMIPKKYKTIKGIKKGESSPAGFSAFESIVSLASLKVIDSVFIGLFKCVLTATARK